MTDLQQVRKMLMKQLNKIDEGKANQKEIENVVAISNSIVKSLNVEVRADELTTNKDIKEFKNKVFENGKM